MSIAPSRVAIFLAFLVAGALGADQVIAGEYGCNRPPTITTVKHKNGARDLVATSISLDGKANILTISHNGLAPEVR